MLGSSLVLSPVGFCYLLMGSSDYQVMFISFVQVSIIIKEHHPPVAVFQSGSKRLEAGDVSRKFENS